MRKLIFSVLFLCCIYSHVFAAVGCSLDDPDRDVKRLFPESSGYLSKFITLKEIGGQDLQGKIEEQLGDKFDAVYENLDVPYAYYIVLKGKDPVGYIHGVNQKGRFGGIQVFMSQDLNGRVKLFYLQRISGQMANKLRDPKFCNKFIGITIKDFDIYDPALGKGSGRIAEIHNPSPEIETDFFGILRGLKKNLILMDEFVFSRTVEKP